MTWAEGDIVVRREVWRGRPWMAVSVIVVTDEPELLVSYLPEGAVFAFPSPDHDLGPHPWQGRGAWDGHGVLMLQRPGERYAVWHFWHGRERAFSGWYVNLQEPFRRTPIGYDTHDLELDVWIPAGGKWSFKDDELLDVRVAEGRFTAAEAVAIRSLGTEVGAMLDAGEQWWDPGWSRWAPPPTWKVPAPADGWAGTARPD
jgi:hypothetical protein